MFDNSQESKTNLSELGEFGLIDHLTKNFSPKLESTIKAIGDDAAVLNFKNKQTLISTDLLVEGVHFDLAYMPLKHLGYKAVMVNLSDIYAMNGTATQITVSFAASNRFPVEALEELYAGIQLAAKLYNVDVIGGDTTSSTSGLMISVTAIGIAEKEEITYRNGAKANDLLVLSGDLGAAYMGLQVLEREKQVFKANPNSQPDLDQYTYLIERQLKPEARQDIPPLLKELEVQPTSMIDISDGLSSEVIHLCKNSKLGANLFEEKIPLDPAVISVCEEFEIDSTMVALSGGEDYELLFTISQDDYDKIKGNPHLTVIGHMTEENEGMHLVTRANQKLPLIARGWNSMENKED
ncbi:thiamine-phosphate kinase [Christiangramia forsetii]|uniref:Thiamine-monophosphate kinase n=2 Tax=Christiangramia forsetii TaxID=411153 RepID=A0M637_CHRFK|nr:thiamine-phosphate kinase [Christiangramia forsetii]GGG31488.1 thiamine-monophosphate kinase [Christiangramia forsetii]CAL68082.1 thiamine-monophosphate kinase [Christiangramia forsetii KT0803]